MTTHNAQPHDDEPRAERATALDSLLSVKWRNVQRLLEELADEDADAKHMHNTARFDVFFHGIAWAKDMADYHESKKPADAQPTPPAVTTQPDDHPRALERDATGDDWEMVAVWPDGNERVDVIGDEEWIKARTAETNWRTEKRNPKLTARWIARPRAAQPEAAPATGAKRVRSKKVRVGDLKPGDKILSPGSRSNWLPVEQVNARGAVTEVMTQHRKHPWLFATDNTIKTQVLK